VRSEFSPERDQREFLAEEPNDRAGLEPESTKPGIGPNPPQRASRLQPRLARAGGTASSLAISMRALFCLIGIFVLGRDLGFSAEPLRLRPADRLAEGRVEAASDTFVPRAPLELAPGFTASLWAAEPMLANPLSLSFDDRGRLLITETHRHRTSVIDVRDQPAVLAARLRGALRGLREDLAAQRLEHVPSSVRRQGSTPVRREMALRAERPVLPRTSTGAIDGGEA